MKYFPVNVKVKFAILIFTSVVLVSTFLGVSQYQLMKNSLMESYDQSRSLLENHIVHIVSATDYTNYLTEVPLEKESHLVLNKMIEAYQTQGNVDFDLSQMKGADSNLDLYIINSQNVIVDATYEPDIGLDFGPYRDFCSYLDAVRENGVFSTDRLSLSIKESRITKYCYMPTPDGRYVFETSSVIVRDKNNPNSLSFDSFGKNLVRGNSFVDRILLYNNYGVAFQETSDNEITIPDEYMKYFEKALSSSSPVSFQGTYEGKKALYKYIPYQIYNADKSTQETVIEIVYNDNDLRRNLMYNLILITSFVLAGALISGAYGLILTGRLIRPLEEITDGVSEIANGNFDIHLYIKSKDEFQVLGDRFTEMAHRINQLLLAQRNKEAEILSQKTEIEALYQQTNAMNDALIELLHENKESYFAAIMALANAEEEKDKYTRGHCERVMKYALRIGKALNLSDQELDSLRYGGILHDIGKIGIPEQILNKEVMLTDEEFVLIKSHPEMGERILRDLNFMKEGIRIVSEHHERIDGAGYPRRLKGDQISLLARIVCVADAYDAMTTARPYRKLALEKEKAIAELIANKGTQFDEHIVDSFIEILRKEENAE